MTINLQCIVETVECESVSHWGFIPNDQRGFSEQLSLL